MKLADFLTEERVVMGLAAETKEELLRELVRRGFLQGQTPGLDDDDLDRIIQVLQHRERLGPTGIKDGLAIPHGKLSGLSSLVGCLGVAKAGIDWGAMDDEKSRVFVVLLSPESSSSDHLKALARVSRLFSGGKLVRRLLDADGAASAYEVLALEDAHLSRG